MQNTKNEKKQLSDDFQAIVNLIQKKEWHELEIRLRSNEIKCLTGWELFLAFYTTVLLACQEIPAQNPSIPKHFFSIFELFNGLNVNIDTISPQGTTILTAAAKAFQPELVRYFISKKADVNISTCFGSPIVELCGQASNLVRSDSFSIEEIELHRPLIMQTALILLENG
ncbi:MAG: hypothetical protein LBQ66_02235, partial [Planctomycetaceae bacterium]|nr:hypothetical protein [Planctomycetaceae bacterium]